MVRWWCRGAATGACLLLTWMAYASEPKAFSAKDPSEWAVRGNGFGRVSWRRELVTCGEVAARYAGARMALEAGSAVRWGPLADQLYHVVFRVDGVELFRTDCMCKVLVGGLVVWRDRMDEWRIEDVPVNPIITDRRFRTAEGVGVGSSVGQLMKAYKAFGRPYYFQSGDLGVVDEEYVCFAAPGTLRESESSVRYIRFYVKNGLGNGTNPPRGYEGEQVRLDASARVIGIRPGAWCAAGSAH